MNAPAHPLSDAPSTDIRILTVATEHLRRHGLERTTVVSVARAAGMSHANVYRYFPSKAALVDAVTALWLRPLEAQLLVVADAPDPADDKLERLLMAWAGALRERLDTDPNVFDIFVEAHTELRGVVRKHRSRIRALVERTVEEGVGSGVFAIRRTDRATTLVLDALFRFIHPAAVRLDRDVSRRVLEERLTVVVRAVLRAMKAGTL
jgi:AcrR family transcriptional regulator